MWKINLLWEGSDCWSIQADVELQKSFHLDLPGGWKRVKTASKRLDWWAVIQTPWKLSEEIWRWETRHRAHVLKGRWEVRGHIDPMWHNDTLPWWLIKASWKFPKCSAFMLRDGVHTFHQMRKTAAFQGISLNFTWIQNIIQSSRASRTSHPLIIVKTLHLTCLWKPHVNHIF